MKITLIQYEVDRIINEPGNKTVMKHFGHMPNIQLLYVASVLERLDVDLKYIDILGMGYDNNRLEAELKSFQPDIIGLSVYTSHFHNASVFAAYLKEIIPQTKVLFGGVHCDIYPEETLRYNSNVDFVCVGEAEVVLPEFIKRLKYKQDLKGCPGIVWRDDKNNVFYGGGAPPLQNLDESPFPARHLIPNEKYYNFISTRKNYTVFNSSRGCPFKCIFCEASGKKWRARSATNVVDEFEECYEKYGIREVDIFDSSFTISKKRVLAICEDLINRGLSRKMIWNVRSRVDTIDDDMLEALKEAGCYRIFYGIESGNSRILEKLRKSADLVQAEHIIKKTASLKISTFGYFLVGNPDETEEEIKDTINFAKKLPLDFAIFNCLTPFPKTPLYEELYLPGTENDFWAEYIKSPKPLSEFIGRPWSDMEDEKLRKIAHKAMLDFYFRPVQIYRVFRSIGSFDQFFRYVLAAKDMALNYISGT